MTRSRLSVCVALTLLLGFAGTAAAQTFNGTLSIVWGDPKNPGGPSPMRYFLALPGGQSVEVLPGDGGGAPLLPLQGKAVVVTGQMSAPPPTVRTGESQVLIAQSILADPSAPASASDRSPKLVSGTKKVLFVLTRFADDATAPHPGSFFTDLTIPDTSGNALIPSTINGFFKKVSGGLFSWVPTVANGGVYLVLPQNKSYYANCDWNGTCFSFNNYMTDVVNAMTAAGVDPTPYDNLNFVMSNDLDCCSWGGGWTIGAKSYGATWEPPWGQVTTTYAHEMGHSIGLPHSGWVYASYDSPWDTMSAIQGTNGIACGSYTSKNNILDAGLGYTNPYFLTCDEPGDGYIAAHRSFLGWIPEYQVPAGGRATVVVEAGSLPVTGNIKMIRICLPAVPCTGTGTTTRYFSVEARVKGLGTTSQFDNAIPANGVIIHDVFFGRTAIGPGGCFFNNQSGWALPIDATPGDWDSVGCSGAGLTNAEFLPGATYTNSTYGFTVKVVSRVGNSYVIQVNGGATLAGDFDGDAKSDMTIYQPDGTWKILKSTSSYTAATIVSWGGAGYVAVPGDYDGDGKLDPAVYNTTTGQWIALKSSTNYTTTFSQSWGGTGYLPEPGDYDGDGKTDLGLYVQSTGQWSILKSSSGYTTVQSASWGGNGYTPVPGKDFDGDGESDIVVYNENAGVWYVLKSSTGFATPMNLNWGGHGYTLVAGDYDGDGKADAGLYERSTGNWYILLSGAGFTTTMSKSWGGVGYDPVPGDYDGDGKYDLGIVQRSTGNWYVLKSSTSYTTSFSVMGWGATTDTLVSGAIVPGGGSDTRRAGDFDGDGKTDITVYTAASGMWYTLTSSSNYTAATNRSWGGTSYAPVPGDYDGDGKTDYGLYSPLTGNWVVLLSGSGFTTTLTKSAGGTGWVTVPADYDGDGKTDIGVYNATTGQWYILLSGSGYTTTLSKSWGGSGYTAVPGDFDGDGKTDLGVYNSTTGAWSVLLSSTSYTTTLVKTVGGTGYIPVQADYDGDGKTDFVVYNTTTGLWYGLKSSTSYTTTLSVSWGGSGYTPIRADFDGDGKADLAIYQGSTGNWYALLSSTNYTTSLSKSWGGGPGYSALPTYP
jgi:hypothetical protein